VPWGFESPLSHSPEHSIRVKKRMSIDVSRLQVSLEEGERWRRTLNITVPREIVQSERSAAIKKFTAGMNLPGFRKGKVPPSVVERRFGPAVDQELLDQLINDAYRGVLRERELSPISPPEVGELDFKPDADFSFSISFDVSPRPELARVEGFKVEQPAAEVTDAQVDEVIEDLRGKEGTWVPAEGGTPADGDLVNVRILRLDGDEAETAGEPRKYEFVLGEGEAIPDVEAGIRSLEVGSDGTFTITFPEDFPQEERRGETQEIRIYLDGRKERELPSLDDEFAAKVGDFESLDDLRARVREDMERELQERVDAHVRDALLDQVISANDFEVPDSMVNHYLRMMLSRGENPDEIPDEQIEAARREIGPQAESQVKRHIVIDRLAHAHELGATAEEIDNEIERLAERFEMEPSDLYTRFQRSGRLERMESELTEKKVVEFLRSGSSIVEAG